MTELKPCPFCGDEPETHVYCNVWEGHRQTFVAEVKCPSCKIARHALATSGKEAGEYLSFADVDLAFRKAEEAWNRRADCSKATVNGKGFVICPASGMEITDDDYCSYGERAGGTAVTDYIERGSLRDALYEEAAVTMRGVAIINTFPAADVRPVVRGEWIEHDFGAGDMSYECSECNEISCCRANFCPDCGADMREDVKG